LPFVFRASHRSAGDFQLVGIFRVMWSRPMNYERRVIRIPGQKSALGVTPAQFAQGVGGHPACGAGNPDCESAQPERLALAHRAGLRFPICRSAQFTAFLDHVPVITAASAMRGRRLQNCASDAVRPSPPAPPSAKNPARRTNSRRARAHCAAWRRPMACIGRVSGRLDRRHPRNPGRLPTIHLGARWTRAGSSIRVARMRAS